MSTRKNSLTDSELAAHPVFSRLLGFMNVAAPKPWSGDFCTCPAKTLKNKRCRLSAQGTDGEALFLELRGLDRYPDTEEGLERVGHFLLSIHCWRHSKTVHQKFEEDRLRIVASRQEKKTAQDNVVIDNTDPNVKTANPFPAVPESYIGSQAQLTDSVLRNHQFQPDGLPGQGIEDAADQLSALTLSPIDESTISFDGEHEMSTTTSTPIVTPTKQSEILEDSKEPDYQEIDMGSPGQAKGPATTQEESINTVSKQRYSRYYKTFPKSRCLIRTIESAFSTEDRKEGIVYILADNDNPDYFKVGFTARTPAERLADRSNCSKDWRVVWPPEPHEGFVGAHRVEALVHADLRQQRNRVRNCQGCHGKTAHKEVFAAPEEVVLHSVQLWTTFVRRLPAYENGTLTAKGQEFLDMIFGRKNLLSILEQISSSALPEVPKESDKSSSSEETRASGTFSNATPADHQDTTENVTTATKEPFWGQIKVQLVAKTQKARNEVKHVIGRPFRRISNKNIWSDEDTEKSPIILVDLLLLERIYADEIREGKEQGSERIAGNDFGSRLIKLMDQAREKFRGRETAHG
ncbi:hypothetical protein DL766_001111 [Monosporascus sp. MC13-8B]|uniref:Bacteriophage T5 Orf172 DNA-binding domain-containing protein n=1 Tax=Monosporascus cannonballus TaxID=155416 RepID=A0ABY0H7E1_9PEZI|nr:hypothetical protein DL762_004532 [Monosporascus cannonballus]RYO90533.1 hypothetical protein DL763_005298 [Monosporascus cannonballus]RYP38201.1 hypothetical protein DL766_001111 [Monosporascus sp. MC13-8B]